ncbi:hypothetical protein CXK91_13915 [Stutzerimonas stutzeri]|uniref:Uncharacterized protein n=1 Tax=Stutzerimonas stutzeri TaxID=316 RepID=A0A2S4ALP6_STUST|nr:hypothetical protein CXK91_13915 [Stutzerimonas stutzeri]
MVVLLVIVVIHGNTVLAAEQAVGQGALHRMVAGLGSYRDLSVEAAMCHFGYGVGDTLYQPWHSMRGPGIWPMLGANPPRNTRGEQQE